MLIQRMVWEGRDLKDLIPNTLSWVGTPNAQLPQGFLKRSAFLRQNFPRFGNSQASNLRMQPSYGGIMLNSFKVLNSFMLCL